MLVRSKHILNDVGHYVYDCVAQVVGLMLKQRNKTAQVGVKHLRDTLTQTTQEITGTFD